MKKRSFFLLVATFVSLLCFCAAMSEQKTALTVTAGEDWSWDPGAFDEFTGELDLSDYTGTELTVVMTSDLSYGGNTTDERSPLFTVINGRRITMKKQSGTAYFTPEEGKSVLCFSGSVRLPEKEHVRNVTLQFCVADANGTELMRTSGMISLHENGSGRETGAFYIPFDVSLITWCALAAAITVWILALIRSGKYNKKRMGE